MRKAKYLFGDIVVVEGNLIGVIVKTWEHSNGGYSYYVYVRMHYSIKEYPEEEIERYRIRHKYLDDEEMEYQNY